MSRKARMPISLKGVEAKEADGKFIVKGPKGTLTLDVMPGIQLNIADEQLLVTTEDLGSNFLGLFWALISNMVQGVTNGFEKKLEMIGVGYRATLKGRDLDLQVGFSHPTQLAIPEGIEVKVDKGSTKLTVLGVDKQAVGQFAANIRQLRPPEPYKGKGIRYSDEYVRRKAGKTGKK